MKIARIVALLLLVATCFTMVVSCKNNGDGTVTTAPPSNTGDPGNPEYPPDTVPNTDYGSLDFTIRCWDQTTKEYDLDQLTESADDVDEALFSRNRKVEERLGIYLKFPSIPGGTTAFDSWDGVEGGSDALDAFILDVHSAVDANLGLYDAVAAYTRCAGALAMKGDYVDLQDVNYIDTDMPWWPEEITSKNTVADRLYFATGDIATSLIYQMEFIIINKEYAEELGTNVEELQQLALDGGWDLQKMFDVTANGWKEMDSTPGKSRGDNFGLFLNTHTLLDIFYMGAGLDYVDTDADGVLVLSEDFNGDISESILQKFQKAFTSNAYFYEHLSSTPISDGKSMLYTVTAATLSTSLRNISWTYHILPAPKYTAQQTEYYTAVGFPHSLYSIPKDAKDKDMSGAVLEVMASESFRQVTPILFDKVFLYKLTNATIDISILTLIRDRTTFDVGRTFFEELGADQSSPVRLWRNLLVNGSTKVDGLVNVNGRTWNITLKGIYDNFAK